MEQKMEHEDQVIHETFVLQLGKHSKAKAKLFLYEFEDDGFTVVYNKSLALSAYGKTPEEAKTMFVSIVFKDFCENLTDLPEAEIYSELKKLGWVRNRIFRKELSNTAHVDKKGVLRDFNLAEDAKIKEHYLAV